MTHVIESLPTKSKALSSEPTIKKKEKKKKSRKKIDSKYS
jgi:predicted GIY-YIG superfamily endonuclease